MSHWYSVEDGSPKYEVEKSSGEGTRPTTLRDARKLNLVPSVTTILSTIAKPMLEKWKQEQLLNAVLEYPFDICTHQTLSWKRKALELSQREGMEAAKRGNIVHDALEQYYLGKKIPKDIKPLCASAIKAIDNEFGPNEIWVPEASFAHPSGFGGKCDLHKVGDNPVVLDFKTKSTEDIDKVKPYTEHCMQLAAYRVGFGLDNADCYNLFISTKTGEVKLYKWAQKDLDKGWAMFKCLLEYWKLDNNFTIKT